jgi:DNA-binding NtrC family response regulator
VEFRALIVDDEETYARSLLRLLARRGVAADHAAGFQDALARARKRSYDLVLLDYLLPDGSGLDLIPPLRALRPAPRILMMTAFGTIENAVEAMRRGAWDYVTKSTATDGIVERVLETRRLAEAQPVAARPQVDGRPAGLLGDSPAMKEVRARLAEVARSPDTTVLLQGESGTGKGVAARAIHSLSARAEEPLVTVDCVALPPTLAESELFGHEKGAFTSADRMRPGKLELCGRGTVLLDEIGDMEPALQGKLLRVLEERTFERVGGVRALPFTARVIAASHRDLGVLVEEKRFRLDLYHRLMVFPIALPPLRERGDDVLLLAEKLFSEFGARLGKQFAPLGEEVRRALVGYGFPGNVRELKNVVERAAILSRGGEIDVEVLPERIVGAAAKATATTTTTTATATATATATITEPSGGDVEVRFRPGKDSLEDLERKLLEEALRRAGGRKTKAAELLGISRYALMRRVEKYGL